MNRKFTWICSVVLLTGFGSAWADDEVVEAETTIRLMGAAEAELPDAVTADIALPESLPEDSQAVENAQAGIDTANENRQRRENGLATADQARESGAEMAEEAQENIENLGRSADRPETPELPEVPQPPAG